MTTDGAFMFVLHAHMPYARMHGRWPHGEEWVLEAAAETYLPLLSALTDLADEGVPFRITITLTPVLQEQLTDPYMLDQLRAYIADLRRPRAIGHRAVRARRRCAPRAPGALLRRASRMAARSVRATLRRRHHRRVPRAAGAWLRRRGYERGDARLSAAVRARLIDRGAGAPGCADVPPQLRASATLVLASGMRVPAGYR